MDLTSRYQVNDEIQYPHRHVLMDDYLKFVNLGQSQFQTTFEKKGKFYLYVKIFHMSNNEDT